MKSGDEEKNIGVLPNESPYLDQENEESKSLIETAIKDESKQSTIYH